jgi:cell wall-associated NlpC family hydrolase
MCPGTQTHARVSEVVPLREDTGATAALAVSNWNSRECTGPTSEVSLYRSSTRRVLAGVAVLAVITPAAEAVEPSTAAASPVSSPVLAAASPTVFPDLAPPAAANRAVASTLPVNLVEVRPRGIAPASRAALRRAVKLRPRPAPKAKPTTVKWTARTADRTAAPAQRTAGTARTTNRGTTAVKRGTVVKQRIVVKRRTVTRRTTTRATTRTTTARRGMTAVIAYARAQVGKSYSSGGSGPNRFDCSGLTMQAYRRAGLRLPHSSGAQAARARTVSRSQALPGDLVVGPGHVGVYMGGGMMVDAGNRRTGVVFRRLYAGLHIERL